MKYAARLLIRVLVAGVGLSLGVQAQDTRTIEFGGEVTVVVNPDVLDDTVAVGGRVRGTYTVATPGTDGVYDVVGWTLRVGNYLFTYTKNDIDTVITTLTLVNTNLIDKFSISTTSPVGDDDVHVVSSTDTEFAWPNNADLVLNVTVQTRNNVWNEFDSEGVSDTTGSNLPDQPFIDTVDELFAATDSSFSIGWRTDYLRNSSAMPVFIDVSPGTDLNSIPLDRGFIRVAILTGGGFDASNVDVTSVNLGPGEAPPNVSLARDVDVDRDGDVDVVLTFDLSQAGFDCGDNYATLTSANGTDVVGTDAINPPLCQKLQ